MKRTGIVLGICFVGGMISGCGPSAEEQAEYDAKIYGLAVSGVCKPAEEPIYLIGGQTLARLIVEQRLTVVWDLSEQEARTVLDDVVDACDAKGFHVK